MRRPFRWRQSLCVHAQRESAVRVTPADVPHAMVALDCGFRWNVSEAMRGFDLFGNSLPHKIEHLVSQRFIQVDNRHAQAVALLSRGLCP